MKKIIGIILTIIVLTSCMNSKKTEKLNVKDSKNRTTQSEFKKIETKEDFDNLQRRFKGVDHWMIGSRPFLGLEVEYLELIVIAKHQVYSAIENIVIFFK